MNSVPADQRGAASGMRATFQNTGMVLSIGVFFSLMIVGLAATLPATHGDGLDRARRAAGDRAHASRDLPPVGSLFAAFLGYNPMQKLLGHADAVAACTRRETQATHRAGRSSRS